MDLNNLKKLKHAFVNNLISCKSQLPPFFIAFIIFLFTLLKLLLRTNILVTLQTL